MNSKGNLFGLALMLGFIGAQAFAAKEVIPLRPLDLPTVTKWVNPERLPAGYEDATVLVGFTLKTTGEPTNIQLVSPRDEALEKCLLPALVQCRFSPVVKNGTPIETKLVLPIILQRFEQDAKQPMKVGAAQEASPVTSLPTLQDLSNEPAMFHLTNVTREGKVLVSDGTAQDAVREALGHPEKLSANVWAYDHFCCQSENADRHGCTTLLLSFEKGQVSALALVNDRAKENVVDQLKFNPSYVVSRLSPLHDATTK